MQDGRNDAVLEPVTDFTQVQSSRKQTASIQRPVLTYARHLNIKACDVQNARNILISYTYLRASLMASLKLVIYATRVILKKDRNSML